MDLQNFVWAEISQPKTNFYDYDITIVGRSGAGKSTLALELFKDHCCLIDVEKGNKSVAGVPKIEPNSWKDLLQLAKTWTKAVKQGNKPPFEVLLFDTQTKLASMCDEYVLSENGWDDFTQGADGKNRWTVRKNEYESLINSFKALGFKIVYICHGKDKKIQLRGQEAYQQFVADVGASFEYAVIGEVDFVFYLEKKRIIDDKGQNKEVRRLVLQNDLDYGVKCRFAEMPNELLWEDVQDGVKQFYEAWDKAVELRTGVKPKNTETPQKPTMPEQEDVEQEYDNDETTCELSIVELRNKVLAIRTQLEETMSKADIRELLNNTFGSTRIATYEDIEMMKDFISKYE